MHWKIRFYACRLTGDFFLWILERTRSPLAGRIARRAFKWAQHICEE
jgi:hypothetical protein